MSVLNDDAAAEIPILSSFALPEDDYLRRYLSAKKFYSLFFVAIYVFVLFAGQNLMKNRKPLPLSKAFLVWNIVLALFSIGGALSVFPEFWTTLKEDGIFESYCNTKQHYYEGYLGFWVFLFHASKLFELGDTLFLVGRKRPVIFLHWYHHCTVLMYTWFTYDVEQGARRWGVFMNYFIHAFMYTYYAMKSARWQCPKFLAPFITTMQIAQFLVGSFFCLHVLYVDHFSTNRIDAPPSCQSPLTPTLVAVAIYFTYFILFGRFFYESYIDKTSSKNKLIDRPVQICSENGNGVTNGYKNGNVSTFDSKKRD
uniref:Elongation of very long chain fatty acids protein n=1 Tax=Romanomermis culicivorax TaxID=13658 RepID=A0A915HLT7_ROMCU